MTTKSPHVRLTDRAKGLVTKILKEDHSRTGETVVWDVSVAVFPDPAATDPLTGSLADPSALVPLPTLVIYLEIPSNEPDTSLYIAPIIAPYNLKEALVRKAVEGALKSLRELRTNLAKAPKSE